MKETAVVGVGRGYVSQITLGSDEDGRIGVLSSNLLQNALESP